MVRMSRQIRDSLERIRDPKPSPSSSHRRPRHRPGLNAPHRSSAATIAATIAPRSLPGLSSRRPTIRRRPGSARCRWSQRWAKCADLAVALMKIANDMRCSPPSAVPAERAPPCRRTSRLINPARKRWNQHSMILGSCLLIEVLARTTRSRSSPAAQGTSS